MTITAHLGHVRSAQSDNKVSASSLWRQQALARHEELSSLLAAFAASAPSNNIRWAEAARKHLDNAMAALVTRSFIASVTGAQVQRTVHNLDMAELDIYRLAPTDYLDSVLPVLIDDAADILPPNDNRLARLTGIKADQSHHVDAADREALIASVYAAKKASLDAHARVRQFRNVIFFAIALATVTAIGVALASVNRPDFLSICHTDATTSSQVCPTGDLRNRLDVVAVMFVGMLGAMVASIFALRKLRGTADPYSLSVALAFLKLPTGALTAFLGPFLIAGGFVPGWTAFDSPQQFIAWSILFGYSQELFTGVIDRQAAVVLSSQPAPVASRAP